MHKIYTEFTQISTLPKLATVDFKGPLFSSIELHYKTIKPPSILIEDTPIGRMIVTNLLAYAEFERAMIMERTMAGKVYKKANDPTYKEGRKEKSVPEFSKFFEKTKKGEMTVIECCAELGISRSKWYKMCRGA